MRPRPVICLAGPTGCGKTALAARLAAELDLEIINADSRQIYADLPIITAQPGPEERRMAPHHLYGFMPCSQKMSAGRYMEAALQKISELADSGRTALLVGGTGLYFQALLRGLASIPPVPEQVGRLVWRRMAEEGPGRLHAELEKIDPICAGRIHANDRQRIARALEVFAATGRTLSWWQAASRPRPSCRGPLIFMDAGLDWLRPRLERRIRGMLDAGALEEAARARSACGRDDLPAFDGIGIREALDCLAGRASLEECGARWLARTRAYAKRQLTWFRARVESIPVRPGDFAGVLALARGALQNFSNADAF